MWFAEILRKQVTNSIRCWFRSREESLECTPVLVDLQVLLPVQHYKKDVVGGWQDGLKSIMSSRLRLEFPALMRFTAYFTVSYTILLRLGIVQTSLPFILPMNPCSYSLHSHFTHSSL